MREQIKELISRYFNDENKDRLMKKIKGRGYPMPTGRRGIRQKKRRQQIKRQLVMSGILFLLIIILGITYNTKVAAKKTKETANTQNQKADIQQGVDEAAEKMEGAALGTVSENETAKQRLKRVKKEAKEKGYPEDIIALLRKNKETVDFVENYEVNKDKPVPKTVSDTLKKGDIPQFLQWDERWGHDSYGTGFIATCGCGPTCMSMVLSGLTGDASITPSVVADYSEKKGYIDENNNTYWSLMSEGGEHWGVTAYGGSTSEDAVAAELNDGHPIICSVGPGDFTKKGHFIVLTKYKDGKVKVHDPFSQKNSDKTWVYDDIKDQIKSLWVYKAD